MNPTTRISALMKFVLFFSLVGCASTPQPLDTNRKNEIKKIAVITNKSGVDASILDQAEKIREAYYKNPKDVWKKTYVGYQFGLIGALVESLVLAAEEKVVESQMMDAAEKIDTFSGNLTLVAEKINNIKIEEIVDKELFYALAWKYSIVTSSRFCTEREDIGRIPEAMRQASVKKTIPICNDLMVDVSVKIDLTHGLALAPNEKLTASVKGRLTVFDIRKNNYLGETTLSSDDRYKKGYTAKQFGANNGALYDQEIKKAARAFAVLVARYLGVPAS